MKTIRLKRFKTLSQQLYFGVVYITLLSIALTGILVGLFYWQAFRTQTIESQMLREIATAADLNSWMGYAIESLKNYAKLLGYKELSQQDRVTLGAALIQENSAFQSITFYDLKKTPILFLNQSEDTNQPAKIDSVGFYIAAISKEEHIGKVVRSKDSNAMNVCISIPVIDNDGNSLGCLSTVINLRYMQYYIAMIPFDRFGYAYILDEQSKVIASNFADMYLENNSKSKTHDYFNLMNNKLTVRVYKGYNGQYVIGSYRAIEVFQWFFIVEYPISAIISKIGNNLLLMLIAFLLSIVLGIWGAQRLYKRIAAPLSELSTSAKKISKGSFDINIKTVATHELGEVATAFNTMSSRLQELFADLELRLKYERLVAEISYMFVHRSTNDLNDLVVRTIGRIGHFTNADRVLFFIKDSETENYTCFSQWASSKLFAKLPERFLSFTNKDYPWMFFQLTNGFPFVLDSDLLNHTVTELLPEHKQTLSWMNATISDTSEFTSISAQQLKYQVTIPFLEQSKLFGLMSIVYLENQPKITDEEIQLYTTLSNVIGNTILKTFNQRWLDEERERLRVTLLSIGDCVLATSADGIIQIINPVAAELIGCDINEAVGKPLLQVFNVVNTETRSPFDDPVKTVISQNKTIHISKDITLISKTSEDYSIELSASPIISSTDEIVGIVVVFRDITEKLASEIEKMRFQKLEAVSYLSAGLAHDFNNLLSAILGNLSLAVEELPEDSSVSRFLQIAEDTVIKGKDITNQLLSFAKGNETLTGYSNLNTLLESTVSFILHGSRVKVTVDIEANLPIVNIAAGVVNQIITNLVINSMQAMNDYGTLAVSAHACEILDSPELPLKPGKYVCIKISDNGKGISPENLKKIFKPYFTTKSEGTGLGLPTVMSVLQKNNGHIIIDSEQGVGTTAILYMPAVVKDKQWKYLTKDITVANPAHVLILEDDVTLCNLMAKTLTKSGLTISETDVPEDVIRMIEEAQESVLPVSILLMDLGVCELPDLLSIVMQIKDDYKSIKIIACSGYVSIDELDKYLEMGFHDILPKPFHINELQAVIGKYLT